MTRETAGCDTPMHNATVSRSMSEHDIGNADVLECILQEIDDTRARYNFASTKSRRSSSGLTPVTDRKNKLLSRSGSQIYANKATRRVKEALQRRNSVAGSVSAARVQQRTNYFSSSESSESDLEFSYEIFRVKRRSPKASPPSEPGSERSSPVCESTGNTPKPHEDVDSVDAADVKAGFVEKKIETMTLDEKVPDACWFRPEDDIVFA